MNEKEKDDFWDLSKIVPKAKTDKTHFSGGVHISDFRTAEAAKPADRAEKLSFSSGAIKSTTETYVPTDNPFIKEIRIIRYRGGYDFYDGFRKAALLYRDAPSSPCPFVPFYSFMPQFTQMNKEQKAYYFYWREQVRTGRYPKTDYSYLYLYVYEILNLPDVIPPAEGLEKLITLWKTYRKELPNIDRYFSVWIADYCIVWKLPCPGEQLRDFIFEVLGMNGFCEFFLAGVKNGNGICNLLSFLSDYDWHTGRYAGGESAAAYRVHMEGALSGLLFKLYERGELIGEGSELSHICRDAFPCSLCTYTVKCRLEIDYYAISKSPALRSKITSAVKYTENMLRSLLGVKSRLAVKDLPAEYKEEIDRYFDVLFRAVNEKRRREARPAYEAHYEAAEHGFSVADADEIERSSWSVTERLVVDEDVCTSQETPTEDSVRAEVPEAGLTPADAEDTTSDIVLSGEDLAFLRAALEQDFDAERRIVKAAGSFAEDFTDRINDAFSDMIGDVVLEQRDAGVCVLEDYTEEVSEWISKQMK